jgi:predicted RNA-binding Zn ribbon-like protein
MFDAAALDLINAGEIDETWLSNQAQRRGIAPNSPPSRPELAEVRRLQLLLRGLTETVAAGLPLSEDELADVNRLLATTPVTAQLLRFPDSGYYVEMTPVADRWVKALVREIVGSWVSLLRLDDPPRLRVCENEACRRAFYDETRNRSRRWCDSRTCGNLIRVRRHRDTRRAA